MAETPRIEGRIDLDQPRWQQNTFFNRARHFFAVTDPRNALLSSSQLEGAKGLLQLYRVGQEPVGTTEEEVYNAKKMYESAFHPETGQKMNILGRMSFQV